MSLGRSIGVSSSITSRSRFVINTSVLLGVHLRGWVWVWVWVRNRVWGLYLVVNRTKNVILVLSFESVVEQVKAFKMC